MSRAARTLELAAAALLAALVALYGSAGLTRIEAVVRRSGGAWVAASVERSGGGGSHGGGSNDD